MSAVKTERKRIPLDKIVSNPQNSNVMSEELLVKLQRNIKRTGLYPTLIVRPLPDGIYEMLDGWHRHIVLERLGRTDAECDVWHVTEREARIALASLNTLRGSEDPRRRAELLDSLLQTVPIEQLATMVTESVPQIEDYQALMQVDLEALELAAKAAASESGEAPQPLTFVLYPEQYVTVRAALDNLKATHDLAGKKNPDGNALYYMAVEYLATVGWEAKAALLAEAEGPIGGSGSDGDQSPE